MEQVRPSPNLLDWPLELPNASKIKHRFARASGPFTELCDMAWGYAYALGPWPLFGQWDTLSVTTFLRVPKMIPSHSRTFVWSCQVPPISWLPGIPKKAGKALPKKMRASEMAKGVKALTTKTNDLSSDP